MANELVPLGPRGFTMNPNFQLLGQPYSNTAGVPVGGPYINNSSMVPYRAGQVPQLFTPSAEDIASALGGEAAAPAVEAVGGEAVKKGILGRLLGGAPAMVAAAALANDPGKLQDTSQDDGYTHFDRGGLPMGHQISEKSLDPSGSDTGASSVVKGTLRGAMHVPEQIGSALGGIKDFFTKTATEREMEQEIADEQKGTQVDNTPDESNLSIDDALGLSPKGSGIGGSVSLPDATSPFSKEDLLSLLAGGKPNANVKGNSGDRASSMLALASAALLGSGNLSPNAKALLSLGYGATEGGLKYDSAVSARQDKLGEETRKWSTDAAKFGLDYNKQEDSSPKIHATRNGIMIEARGTGPDGKSYTTLTPLSNAVFGAQAAGALDPKAKIDFMGQKYSGLDKVPFGKEITLLARLEQSGQLQDIMTNNAEAFKKADKEALKNLPVGAGPKDMMKAQQDARRAVLLQSMANNPKFRAEMIKRANALKGTTTSGSMAPSDESDVEQRANAMSSNDPAYEDVMTALQGGT